MARPTREQLAERQIREIRMVWRGPIAAFMRDETRIIDLEGAIRCLTPWTPIEMDGATRLIGEDFGRSGFDVPTWDGSSRCNTRAGALFLKSYRPAFRVHLDSGEYFDGCDTHRVLTIAGWLSLGQLVRLSSGLRCWDKRQDWTASCDGDDYRDDVPLLLGLTDAGLWFPSPSGVQGPIWWRVWLAGERDTRFRYTRVYRSGDHLSSRGVVALADRRHGPDVDPTPAFDAEWCSARRREWQRAALDWHRWQRAGRRSRGLCPVVADVGGVGRAFFPSSHPPLVGGQRIVSIIALGVQPIVDFEVPATHCYEAAGVVHHNSGKTTACIWKVFNRLQEEPGLQAFLCRWTDGDTDSKLRPVWRAVCEAAGLQLKWNPDEQYDELPNGSRAYIFGLKSADQILRYSKLRGLTVAVIYNDQTEELPHDIFLELCGRLSQPGFRHQAIFSPNPTSPDHWLAQEFPADNRYPGKSYLHLSIYDNAHNLAPGTIEGVVNAFPPGHSKHRPMVLGLRGLNVIGTPCYQHAFDRTRHEKPLDYNPDLPLSEGYDFGKHHPCVVFAQFPLGGGIAILGGIMGQNLWLEDFLPLVQQCRSLWFGHLLQLQTCCDPAGTHDHAHGTRENALQVLKRFYPEGHRIEYRENSNAPDVRIALVERIAGHMRRRTPWGEAFAVDGTKDLNHQYVRWLRVDKDGAEGWGFLADGCEAGYVWDSHFVSVGSKQMRKPKRDGWYEHGQACLEYLELNFGGAIVSEADEQARSARLRDQQARARDAQRPILSDPGTSWMS